MSRLWATKIPSEGKIAFGPLLFDVLDDGVLDPQPTEEQIRVYKFQGYLKQVVATEPSKAEVPVPLPSFEDLDFELKLGETSSDVMPPPVDDSDDVAETPKKKGRK